MEKLCKRLLRRRRIKVSLQYSTPLPYNVAAGVTVWEVGNAVAPSIRE